LEDGHTMGSGKDNMKTTAAADPKGADTLLGKLTNWTSKKGGGKPKTAENFADNVANAHAKLQTLLATKKADLLNEKNREDYNRQAVAILNTMNHHLEDTMDLICEYAELT